MWFDNNDDPISWFFRDLFKRNFIQAEVLMLAGERLKPDTLQNWANRKYVLPKVVRGKRRYNAAEVAQVSLAQPLIHSLGVEPSIATLMILNALLILQRKLKSEEFSLNQAPHWLCFFASPNEDPIFVQQATAAPFESSEAFIVLPFGRLLDDLAKRQKQIVESRSKRKST